MSSWRNSSERHYTNTGSYWPRRRYDEAGMRMRSDKPQRYGVLQIAGYYDVDGGQYGTQFLVIDTDVCARVVAKYSRKGRPGMDNVQRARVLACELADRLNRREREPVAA